MSNRTILQNFEWYLPSDGRHWQRTSEAADDLAWLGFSDVWLPPAYKGHTGMMDVGYGVYDLYDLGEFYQKGAISTKYGTKEEYIAAIKKLQSYGVRVLADIVLNHRMGADYTVDTYGVKVEGSRRRKQIIRKELSVWAGFDFDGRNGKYSSMRWNDRHFSGYDWNEKTKCGGLFVPDGKEFSENVSDENDNYDYLMGADVDFSVDEVREELIKWGKWYLDTARFNGVRIDAVKHIDSDYFPVWLAAMREHAREVFKESIHEDQDFFAVGEYWENNLGNLQGYLHDVGGCMSLFDVPLQAHFREASLRYEKYDLRGIFDNTLVGTDPEHAVTIVDNHDTQPNQKLFSWVEPWFKPLAYSLILLRKDGTPCVFYGDLYSIPRDDYYGTPELRKILVARRRFAHGWQKDYFDHPNTVGWTREGGLAVVISNGSDGWKDMQVGMPGDKFFDVTGHFGHDVTIDDYGYGHFDVKSQSVSIWIPVRFREERND